MLARHYAPRTPLICVRSIAELPQSAEGRLGLVVIGTPVEVVPPHFAEQRYLPGKGDECAAVLYDTLHELDHLNLYQIVVVLPPDTEEWIAIRDRLNRAATKE
jgi:L-threonylcarbamoyladenylate synthase